jgi:hypothetical protein
VARCRVAASCLAAATATTVAEGGRPRRAGEEGEGEEGGAEEAPPEEEGEEGADADAGVAAAKAAVARLTRRAATLEQSVARSRGAVAACGSALEAQQQALGAVLQVGALGRLLAAGAASCNRTPD